MSALEILADDERALLRPGPPPAGSDAMRAKLTDIASAVRTGSSSASSTESAASPCGTGAAPRLWSRNDLSLDSRYPEIVEALAGAREQRFAVDGEVVAFVGGQTSFERLAQRGQRPVAVFYYVFDVLWIDGRDLRALPLRTRKRLLRELRRLRAPRAPDLAPQSRRRGVLRRGLPPSLGGPDRQACGQHLHIGSLGRLAEVQVRARAGAGDRRVHRAARRPERFGALLVGYFDKGELRYAGKVGTGFDQITLDELGDKLEAARRENSPFAAPDEIRERNVTWVRPELVAQIGFTEWTAHGRLRHPRFQGLRDDKAARDVVREG